MSNYFLFWFVLLILAAIVVILDRRYYMLRDNGTVLPRPYSFSRVQLAWWSVIILSSIITIMITKEGVIPDLSNSTLYLLGISSATTVGATLIDISDQTNPNLTGLSQNMKSDNFFLDILSDKNGVNVHRFQTVIFNLVFSVWFIKNLLLNLSNTSISTDNIIPVFSNNNLILLGVSSGLYTALKATENKQSQAAVAQPQPASQNAQQA